MFLSITFQCPSKVSCTLMLPFGFCLNFLVVSMWPKWGARTFELKQQIVLMLKSSCLCAYMLLYTLLILSAFIWCHIVTVAHVCESGVPTSLRDLTFVRLTFFPCHTFIVIHHFVYSTKVYRLSLSSARSQSLHQWNLSLRFSISPEISLRLQKDPFH